MPCNHRGNISNNILYILLLVALFFFTPARAASNLGSQFVTAKLAYGASIDLPRSWQVMRGNNLRTIETAVGAAIDLSGYARLVDGTESLLVSTFTDPELYAGVTVTSTPLPGSSRSAATMLTESQLKSGELVIRRGLEAIFTKFGGKAWGWTPLTPILLSGIPVLHISYLRSSDGGPRRVHIYKFFGTGRIYDVALSTSVAAEDINDVILKRIADSFFAP